MTDHYREFTIPDTELTRQAHALAERLVTPAIAHHSVRSYLFGRELGAARGLRPGHDYDDELLFLACVLHDASLSDAGGRGDRFEVEGADLAAEFLREHGVGEERVQTVWEAIALHTAVGISHRLRPEIALTHLGAGADVVARGTAALPAGYADRVHAAFPRLEPDGGLPAAIAAHARRDPAGAPLFSFGHEILRQAEPGRPVADFALAARSAWPGVV
ncbi:HD domain-containing protein [Kitasatospora terrestris]|uniref:HD domain-containing protein n=1 Tax=Kitasatospora terrestris TaxID=258051 RepID=A0ABP9D8U0_9ACTN